MTTALCCALRFPTLPSPSPAPPGLTALGKNVTAKGKPLRVTSRCCLETESGFKDGRGTRCAWAGTLPTAARRLGGSVGSHPPSAAIGLPVLPLAEPCRSRRSGYVPGRVPGALTARPRRQKGREVLAPSVWFTFIPFSAGVFTISVILQAWGGGLCLSWISSRQCEKWHLSFCAFPMRLDSWLSSFI